MELKLSHPSQFLDIFRSLVFFRPGISDYYFGTKSQTMNFFYLSAKMVIFDMPWIMNGEYITYTFLT